MVPSLVAMADWPICRERMFEVAFMAATCNTALLAAVMVVKRLRWLHWPSYTC